MQSGKDGQYIGIPSIKFNEYGQITDIDYNLINTDDYERSPIAKDKFEHIIKPTVLGEVDKVDKMPENLYVNENQNCDFILDCIREELNTDAANAGNGTVYIKNIPTESKPARILFGIKSKIAIQC